MQTPQPADAPVYPGNQGGTNWYPPAWSPRTGLFYFSVWENYASIMRREEATYEAGRNFTGGGTTGVPPVPGAPSVGLARRGPIDTWTSEVGTGATVALDPKTGKRVWSFPQYDVTTAGNLVTASDILFTGGNEGYFYALNAKSGEAVVEGQPWWRHRDGAGDLCDRWQAVYFGECGKCPEGCVRT